MTPQILLVWIGSLFALFLVGAMALFIMDIFFDPVSNAGIFTNDSYSANATVSMILGVQNLFTQIPNVGKLAGVSLLIGVLSLMGVGAYAGYQRFKQ